MYYRDSGKPRYVTLNIKELILKATEDKFQILISRILITIASALLLENSLQIITN